MEKNWNDDVIRFAEDLHKLKVVHNNDGPYAMLEIFHEWIKEYFHEKRFKGSTILDYEYYPDQYQIKVTFLDHNLSIKFEGMNDVFAIKAFKPDRQEEMVEYYSIDTLKSENKKILTSKTLFEILDTFTHRAHDNYLKSFLYLRA
ncbi:hypothetical protein JOC25_000007 [Solibacillus kalamii]|uniref:Uncharacterized protein n=1 Tax=Solibacillus kalamii TaxID=1748298 RepID=A0ABX3ZHH4_9BACL|nr:hypothetical protein [Solibacillus kalamii]MBM7663551.1 hypothetical protein [Solibacillus kalamii]OUZ39183.1 hypothetical protein CBM15_10005 [Solibacillus kalamii]